MTLTVQPFPDEFSRAVDYPYAAPDNSYVLHSGKLEPFNHSLTAERTAILCIGSNIAPIQLLRKFGSDAIVPVQRAWLQNHDVVFASRFAPYGAVPAMLHASRGTRCFLAIAWLDDEQLEMMDKTEADGYNREWLEQISLRTLEGDDHTQIIYYRCVFAPYIMNEQPVAIATIDAKERHFPELSCQQLLNVLFQEILEETPNLDFPQFIATLAQDNMYREDIVQKYLQP